MAAIGIHLRELRVDGGTQMRVEIDEDVVAEYADAIRAGATMPPIAVVFDGASYWLADGFHRYHAHRKLKLDSIKVEVTEGGKEDAVLMAAGANAKHGLQRSAADKRKAISALMALPLCEKWSDREFARHCNVSPALVADVRRVTIYDVNSDDRQYVDKHGNLSTMNVSAIGGKSPGRPKSAARLAKEARDAESEERAKDILDGFDPVKELDLANEQNEALIEENTALKADDTKAELAKQIELRRISDRLSHSQTNTIHEMDKELRRFIAWFKELRQLTGCESNSAAMAAIRIAFARSA